MKKGGVVYILKSKRNGTYYVGSTQDLDVRFKQHCKGKNKYTKNILPLELVFHQNYDNILTARQIEYKLKKLKNKKILERIVDDRFINLS